MLRRSIARLGSLIGFAVILAVGGCWDSGADRIVPPGINAKAAGSAAMEQYDTNKDGKVAGGELDKAPSLKAAIDNLDTNGDGAVSAEEITARIEVWQDSRVGIFPIDCTVYYKGRPLPGATVTLEPEKFLGDAVKTSTGVSDENGTVILSVELDPSNPNIPPGVHPGLYLVRITKDGMDIPAKYNIETIFGEEIAQGSRVMEEPMEFRMK